MNAAEMEQALQQLKAMSDLIYAKEPLWQVASMELMPPAEVESIGALAAESPFPLPPSYVRFLKLHDGCLNLWPKFALLGTNGKPRDIVLAEIEDAREFQSEYAADDEGEVTEESIAAYETPKNDDQEFFLPAHLVFGADRGGEFLMFNEKREASKGEYEVVHYTYSGGAYYRYPDFPSFLNFKVGELEKRIKEKGYSV